MPDVFISHVEEDGALAEALSTGLELSGYRTWYYERDSVPGPSYLEQTMEAIEASSAVLVLASASALAPRRHEADKMTKEIEWAHEGGKRFVPLLIDVRHEELRARRPGWRAAFGLAHSPVVARGDVAAVIPNVVKGLEHFGISPSGAFSAPIVDAVAVAAPLPAAVSTPSTSIPVFFWLFEFETLGGKKSPLWMASDDEQRAQEVENRLADFTAWQATRRTFDPGELTRGHWVKVSDRKSAFLVSFETIDRPAVAGTLRECALFAQERPWSGTWSLRDGCLTTRVADYHLFAIGARQGGIHGAVEWATGRAVPHACFKLMRIEDTRPVR